MEIEPLVQTIPITVDKSHLITIGEKLYSESIELIRELVNNAYDADAIEIQATISEDFIIVQDNGTGMDLALQIDHFGPDSPESFTQGDLIHINRDHPLYKRESIHKERYRMHVARLLCREIALRTNPRGARQTFERQSKLLRDAFIAKKE